MYRQLLDLGTEEAKKKYNRNMCPNFQTFPVFVNHPPNTTSKHLRDLI